MLGREKLGCTQRRETRESEELETQGWVEELHPSVSSVFDFCTCSSWAVAQCSSPVAADAPCRVSPDVGG